MGNDSSRLEGTDWATASGLLRDASETVDGSAPVGAGGGVYVVKKRNIVNSREYDVYAEEDYKNKMFDRVLFRTKVPRLSIRIFDVLDGPTGRPLVRVKPVAVHNGEWQFLRFDEPAFDGQEADEVDDKGDVGRPLYRKVFLKYTADDIGHFYRYARSDDDPKGAVGKDYNKKDSFLELSLVESEEVGDVVLKEVVGYDLEGWVFQTYLPEVDEEEEVEEVKEKKNLLAKAKGAVKGVKGAVKGAVSAVKDTVNEVLESSDSEEESSDSDDDDGDEKEGSTPPLVGFWDWDNEETELEAKMRLHLVEGSDLVLHVATAIATNILAEHRDARDTAIDVATMFLPIPI